MNHKLMEVHILKNLLNLNDDMYRDMLSSNYGTASSKELNPSQLTTLINSLKYLFNSNKTHLTYEQLVLIKKLAKGKINDLQAYSEKILRKDDVHLQSISRAEASLLIRTLKNYKK